jgi:predicted TIM-barrel fold metal-dependent hydrolase
MMMYVKKIREVKKMIIDFHTHIFPDDLASKAMHALTASIDNLFTPIHNGTVSGLLDSMTTAGIDISVVLPVITKPTQFQTTNEWVRSISSERLIGFGGIYPHTDNYKRDINYISDLGLAGLKFHAEYQNFVLDDPKMLKIYDYALSKGLILLHHAGVDPGFVPPFKSTPQQFSNIVKTMGGGTIIAAHLGGLDQWDDVEKYLVGTDIYLDTSIGFEYFSKEQFLRIARNHGTDKILFASDSPWSNTKTEIDHLHSLPLTPDEKTAILGGNAKRLLKIPDFSSQIKTPMTIFSSHARIGLRRHM